MSRPDIGFSLTIDGCETYKLAPAGSVAERIREIIGAEAADNMLKVDSGEIDGVSVTGFIERPDLGPAGRREQYVFINGRAATAPQIAIALKEACPRRIMDSRPLAVIFVNVPNTMVDVNVHPSKREVRFRNGAAVKEAVRRAIAEATRPRRRMSQDRTTRPALRLRKFAKRRGRRLCRPPSTRLLTGTISGRTKKRRFHGSASNSSRRWNAAF